MLKGFPRPIDRDGVFGRRQPTILTVPGLGGSGPDHWQSRWERTLPWVRRAELGLWDTPDRDLWVRRLDQAIARASGPVILAAHSLGAILVAWWAASRRPAYREPVAGALLVAPADCEAPEVDRRLAAFRPMPLLPLPFPSILVASRDDPFLDFETARRLSGWWGSHLVDAGPAGHLNAASGLGDWALGLSLVDRLADCAEASAQAEARLVASVRFAGHLVAGGAHG
jgi:hypothetical protein